MELTISQQTMAEILQLGTQYAIPIAALLRAIYNGWRGKFPEGFRDIAGASLLAGLTAVADNQSLDLGAIVLDILGNTIFMAGLLTFIMMYLLRQPDRGLVVDGIVGGVLGAVVFVIWVGVLGNPFPWWTIPLVIGAGTAGFIALRFAYRQIVRMVQIATYFLVIGLMLAIGAGAVYAYQLLTAAPAAAV